MNGSAVETPRAVIVISSHVARGSVGNRAAVFALETLGHPVWAVPTVLLPWHPGHGPATRIVPDADQFSAFMKDLERAPWLGEVAGVLSGYLGDARQAVDVAALVHRVKAKNPRRDLYLRSGDGRRRRALCSRGDGRGHARPSAAARRYRHAQPLRARMDRGGEARRSPLDHRRGAGSSVRRACW